MIVDANVLLRALEGDATAQARAVRGRIEAALEQADEPTLAGSSRIPTSSAWKQGLRRGRLRKRRVRKSA